MTINRLFLCEKPGVARLIAPKLGNQSPRQGYIQVSTGDAVTWTVGHAYENADVKFYDSAFTWSKDRLPFIPRQFVILPKSSMLGQLKVIKTLLQNTKTVISVGDPDREGNLLIDEILEKLGWNGPTGRIFIYAQDDKSISKAVADIKNNSDFACWTKAARLRNQIDWLSGINHTVALTTFARTLGISTMLTVGRVQTPLLNMIVERFLENKNFIPKTYFALRAVFNNADNIFSGLLQTNSIDSVEIDSEGRVIGKKLADEIKRRCAGLNGTIESVEQTKQHNPAPLPFSLSSLQAYANKTWGLEPVQTLAAAQTLYDAGYTTYPRSGCEYIPEAQHTDAQEILNMLQQCHHAGLVSAATGANVSIKSRAFNDKKIGAHYAIIPTVQIPDLKLLPAASAEVYAAIAMRYVLQFYPEETYETQTIITNIEGYYWKSTGRRTLSLGWRSVSTSQRDEDSALPTVAKGDPISCKAVEIEEKQTTPPPLFTPGTIITAMEEAHKFVTDPQHRATLRGTEGLGTEATRANIYEGLKKRGYIVVQKNKILPTPLGQQLIDLVTPEMKSIAMTAILEGRLEQVSNAEADPAPILNEYANSLKPAIDALFLSKPSLSAPIKSFPCPKCGANLIRVKSKKNKKLYWVCSSGQECEFTIVPDDSGKPGAPRSKAVVHDDFPCPNCGKALAQHDGKYGQWWGCTGFKEGCDYRASDDHGRPGSRLEKPKAVKSFACPECGQSMKYIKSSKSGEFWHICENGKKHKSKKTNFFPDRDGSPVLS